MKDIGKEKAKVIYTWNIENAELHKGLGALRGRYFKTHGRYYYVQCFQFSQGSPDADLGAIVFDVTGLPDSTKVKEVARIHVPDAPGGFHNIYTYKHSDGRVLLFTSTSAKSYAQIFDMDKLLAGAPDQGLVGRITNPDRARRKTITASSARSTTTGSATIRPRTRTSSTARAAVATTSST